jgi:hypothetical protein
MANSWRCERAASGSGWLGDAAAGSLPAAMSVDDPDPKLDRQYFIVRDANGHALTYEEPGSELLHCCYSLTTGLALTFGVLPRGHLGASAIGI